jgi:peptide/nickel transport system substrate-binding protein
MIRNRLTRRAALTGLAGAGLLPRVTEAAAALSPSPGPAIDRDTVVIALERDFSNLDALVAITSDSNRYVLQIYDTLYGFDAHGQLVPRLATAVAISEDGLSYTYTLRPGVRFHNGGVLTSDDVRFSLDHILDPASKSTRRPQLASVVAAIETPDPGTVIFRLKQRDGAFPNKIAGYLPVVPRDYGSSQPAASFFARSPVSLGPYRVRSFRMDYLELERFDDYWGEKPKVKRLIFKVIPEAGSRTAALLTGEVDLVAGVPFQDFATLRQTPGLFAVANPLGSPLLIHIDADKPGLPTFRRAVRQALSYGIDTQAIIDTVLHGAGEKLAGMISRYYPYGSDPALQPYPYDPAKARQLLEGAGYPDGFEARLVIGSDHPIEIAEAAAGYWAQIGVRIRIQRYDYATWAQLNNTHKAGPLGVMQMANAIYDPIHPVGGVFARAGTWCDYDNPEVEALIQRVIPVTDAAERGGLFREINRRLHDDAASIFISELHDIFAARQGLAWAPQPGTGYLNFRRISWTA